MYSIRVSHLITAVCELRGMLSTGEGRASYEYRGEYEREDKVDKAVRVRIILSEIRGAWCVAIVRRPAVRLSSLRDSDRLDCVVRDGGWAWGGRAGTWRAAVRLRLRHANDTLAPLPTLDRTA